MALAIVLLAPPAGAFSPAWGPRPAVSGACVSAPFKPRMVPAHSPAVGTGAFAGSHLPLPRRPFGDCRRAGSGHRGLPVIGTERRRPSGLQIVCSAADSSASRAI
jgi:hypothetical protein